MTAALLENDRIKDRRNQLRREASRQEFLSQPTDCRLEIADCRLLEAKPATEGRPTEPTTLNPGEPPRDDAPLPQSAVCNPQSAIESAELLSDPNVREILAGKTPSRRNREIFRAVVIGNRLQSDVAAEFGVSQPRVSQIVQQVTRWLSENVVQQDRPRSGLEQIQFAENLVRMQYDHLYATALDLLHGRTSSSAPSPADGDGQQPHKPNSAFLNTALRVVNSRAKFEGLNGRPARRAMDEAEQRGVSMFGPTNDGLERDDGAEQDEEVDSNGSYNPLSGGGSDEDDWPSPQEVSESFREAYKQHPDWFRGDFDARGAYYRTQTRRVYGDVPEEEVSEGEKLQWLHEMDLRGAAAQQEARDRVAREPGEPWPPEKVAACRRQLLIRLMHEDGTVRYDCDAHGLLACGEYDDASGRFGWDRRFMALTGPKA